MEYPIPVVLCGKTAQIASTVVSGLQPDVEGTFLSPSTCNPQTDHSVIHVIFTPDSFISTIPPLLSGSPPQPISEQIGTQNYARRPVAIVTGGGFDDAMVESMREACKNAKVDDIPFLRPDLAVPTPPLGPKYGAAMVQRVKACLAELEEEGRLVGGGIFYY